jgi:hypothetical protein
MNEESESKYLMCFSTVFTDIYFSQCFSEDRRNHPTRVTAAGCAFFSISYCCN